MYGGRERIEKERGRRRREEEKEERKDRVQNKEGVEGGGADL